MAGTATGPVLLMAGAVSLAVTEALTVAVAMAVAPGVVMVAVVAPPWASETRNP